MGFGDLVGGIKLNMELGKKKRNRLRAEKSAERMKGLDRERQRLRKERDVEKLKTQIAKAKANRPTPLQRQTRELQEFKEPFLDETDKVRGKKKDFFSDIF